MKRARRASTGRAAKRARSTVSEVGDADEDVYQFDDDDVLDAEDAALAAALPPVPRIKLSLPGKKDATTDAAAPSAPPPTSSSLSGMQLRLSMPKQEGEEAAASTSDLVASLFDDLDYAWLDLKPDHAQRPVWVCPDGRIFLETFSPVYQQAYDFIIAIAEPQSRPPDIHEYQLTEYSLYAAVSVGLEPTEILNTLERLSKTKLPDNIATYVQQVTESYGKLKLVLQQNRFFVESSFPAVLQKILQDPEILAARLRRSNEENEDLLRQAKRPEPMSIPGGGVLEQERDQLAELINDDGDIELARPGQGNDTVHSFEINPEHVEQVKRRCGELEYPMMEEYDFRNDTMNASVEIDLKATTSIRRYQEKSLSKMFGNGRARSGIIVLPCGAGKTLVGITATSTVKKSTLVLCTSSVAVDQWKNQFALWSTVADNVVTRFTAAHKEMPAEPGIVISTYPMIAHTGRRSKAAAEIMEVLKNREWGLLVLDEVHVVPANMFRKVLTVTKTHCKLGLTATLVREDDKIGHLNFLIGPKLYEANWLDLQQAGHIAKVQCAEVWCEMSPEFYREYLNAELHKKRLLFVMNPNKFQACEYLIRVHEARGDKIIVFADNLFALKEYATRLKKYFICGEVQHDERKRILHFFQHRTDVNTILISKVGDNSIDLPEANVIIQISSHFGSRRQEAQRLGRILRPKSRNDGDFNAFFYSLVSRDTQEMFYSTKRQQFLVDQGYSFKVIDDITKHDWPGVDRTKLLFRDKKSQIELLARVLAVGQDEAMDEEVDGEDMVRDLDRRRGAVRRAGSLKALSGSSGKVYSEFAANKRSEVQRHPLFKKFYKGAFL